MVPEIDLNFKSESSRNLAGYTEWRSEMLGAWYCEPCPGKSQIIKIWRVGDLWVKRKAKSNAPLTSSAASPPPDALDLLILSATLTWSVV